MPVDDPFDMDWPDFDPRSKCVKCGYEIPEPEPAPEKPSPATKPKPKAETAAEDAPAPGKPKPAMQLPVQAPAPTVAYCNGEKCPCFDDEIDQHMHQFCDTCGYEWIAKTLDAS